MYYPKDFNHVKPRGKVKLDKSGQENDTLTKPLSNMLEEFCIESSFHGLKYVQDLTLPRTHRMFWFVIFMTSFITGIIIVVNTYQNIYKDTVEMSLKATSSWIKDIPFPAIMICSSFPVRKSYFDLDLPDSNKTIRHYSKVVCADDEDLDDEHYNSTLTNEFFDFLNEASIPCHQFLLNCRWNNIEEDCCELFKPFISSLGKCYVFNNYPEEEVYRSYTYPVGHKASWDERTLLWHLETGYPDRKRGRVYPRWSEVSGAITGLTVTLVENRSEWQQACNGGTSGSNLVLFTPLENPDASYRIKIPMNLHTHIRVDPTLVHSSPDMKNVSIEERICLFQGEVLLKYFNIYNQVNCFHECFINKTLEKCGCVHFEYQGAIGEWNKPYCGDGQLECVDKVKFKISYIPDGPNDTTKCKCMPLCTSVNYNIESSFEQIEYSKHQKYISESFNYSHGTIVSQVSVYFSKSVFVPLVRKSVDTFGDSLSNCGGLLGLLLGFSFMSGFEVFYFVLLRPLVKLFKNVCIIVETRS